MKKFLIIFLVWFISIIYSIIWTFENPEKIEKIKSIVKKNKSAQVEVTQSKSQTFIANSFIEISKSEPTFNQYKLLPFESLGALLDFGSHFSKA